jgi:hypothetical protein
MSLFLRATRGFGPDHFSVFDGERKIARIYRTRRGDWFWGVDWFAAGQGQITDYAATPEEAMAQLKAAWEREEARRKFTAAWQG